jgi:hypothetical protein
MRSSLCTELLHLDIPRTFQSDRQPRLNSEALDGELAAKGVEMIALSRNNGGASVFFDAS